MSLRSCSHSPTRPIGAFEGCGMNLDDMGNRAYRYSDIWGMSPISFLYQRSGAGSYGTTSLHGNFPISATQQSAVSWSLRLSSTDGRREVMMRTIHLRVMERSPLRVGYTLCTWCSISLHSSCSTSIQLFPFGKRRRSLLLSRST